MPSREDRAKATMAFLAKKSGKKPQKKKPQPKKRPAKKKSPPKKKKAQLAKKTQSKSKSSSKLSLAERRKLRQKILNQKRRATLQRASLLRARRKNNKVNRNRIRNHCKHKGYNCQCNFNRYHDMFDNVYDDVTYKEGINLPPCAVRYPVSMPKLYNPYYEEIGFFNHFGYPDDIYSTSYGSGLGHDPRMPFIAPGVGMDAYSGSYLAPPPRTPLFQSYPDF